MQTRDIFCAKCQAVTPHSGRVDHNGEFVFTCMTEECGRFVKFPADIDLSSFNQLAQKHHVANVGQVSLEAQEEKLAEIFALPEIEPYEEPETAQAEPEVSETPAEQTEA